MKAAHFRIGFVVAVIFFAISSTPSRAQEDDNQFLGGGGGSKARYLEDADVEHWSIRLQGGFSWESHTLTSSDASKLNVNLPSTRGALYGAELRFSPRDSMYSFRARYRMAQTEFTGLTSVTPSTITEKRTEISGVVFLQFLKDSAGSGFSPLKLGVGYFISNRDVPETLAQAIMTKSSLTGLSLHLSYDHKLGTDFRYEGNFSYGLVSSINEEFQRTGFFGSGSIARFEFALGYEISRWVDISIIPGVRLERLNFKGTGARNAVDGYEKNMTVEVPLELKIKF